MKPPSTDRPHARRGRPRKPRLLELRITVANIEPPIWRAVRMPDAYTLHQLHRIVQLLFGWLDYHLYDFRVGERMFEAPDDEAEGEDATAVRLADLRLEKDARFTYTYDFGDGWVHEIVVDDVNPFTPFEDDLRLLPMLLGGARAGPPEDCGGPHSYAEMLEALRDPAHPQHGDYRGWAGAYDPEAFDLRTARHNLALAAVWGAL